jgi:hypothetical protein
MALGVWRGCCDPSCCQPDGKIALINRDGPARFETMSEAIPTSRLKGLKGDPCRETMEVMCEL